MSVHHRLNKVDNKCKFTMVLSKVFLNHARSRFFSIVWPCSALSTFEGKWINRRSLMGEHVDPKLFQRASLYQMFILVVNVSFLFLASVHIKFYSHVWEQLMASCWGQALSAVKSNVNHLTNVHVKVRCIQGRRAGECSLPFKQKLCYFLAKCMLFWNKHTWKFWA